MSEPDSRWRPTQDIGALLALAAAALSGIAARPSARGGHGLPVVTDEQIAAEAVALARATLVLLEESETAKPKARR